MKKLMCTWGIALLVGCATVSARPRRRTRGQRREGQVDGCNG